jgi:Relaxase/Mobilisation nuclease domain
MNLNRMLIKFFHRGDATSDSALAYLLSEAPLKYLTGARDRQGVVRNPAPVVVKGTPELTRKLINQCPNKNKYTSGVISCERMISKVDEKEIIRRFERAAFAGLRDHQFQCLWIRHSHLGRTELHFLVPKNELTTLKALNINPPRQRKEGLYDSFRKLTNHEFNLKDPSGVRLTRAEHSRLTQKLAKLVAARTAYNRSRYPAVNQERIEVLVPNRGQDRTGSLGGSPATPRSALPARTTPTRPTTERLGRATRTFGEACQRLDGANCELGRTTRALQGRLAERVARRKRIIAGKSLFVRYGIPETSSPTAMHDRNLNDLTLDLTDNL